MDEAERRGERAARERRLLLAVLLLRLTTLRGFGLPALTRLTLTPARSAKMASQARCSLRMLALRMWRMVDCRSGLLSSRNASGTSSTTTTATASSTTPNPILTSYCPALAIP